MEKAQLCTQPIYVKWCQNVSFEKSCSFLHVSASTLLVCLACMLGPDHPMQADPLSAT